MFQLIPPTPCSNHRAHPLTTRVAALAMPGQRSRAERTLTLRNGREAELSKPPLPYKPPSLGGLIRRRDIDGCSSHSPTLPSFHPTIFPVSEHRDTCNVIGRRRNQQLSNKVRGLARGSHGRQRDPREPFPIPSPLRERHRSLRILIFPGHRRAVLHCRRCVTIIAAARLAYHPLHHQPRRSPYLAP